MSKKIYLSPSNQTANKFIIGNTNEGVVWNEIAERLKDILLRDYDCEVKVCKPSQTLAARAAEAAAWGANVYIAMHSNAAGTANIGARGVEVYYDARKGEATKELAKTVLNDLSTLFKNRGLKQSSKLIDCYKPAMPSIIGECGFHDNTEDCKLILNNKDLIARLYCASLAKYLKLNRKTAPTPAPAPTPPTVDNGIAAGDLLKLTNVPLYVSATAKTKSNTVTGNYYFWGGSVVNKRIRITNSKSRVGISGQVTGWIDSPTSFVIYTVKAGDTLSKIASAYNTTVRKIADENKITNPNLIIVGQVLRIPV